TFSRSRILKPGLILNGGDPIVISPVRVLIISVSETRLRLTNESGTLIICPFYGREPPPQKILRQGRRTDPSASARAAFHIFYRSSSRAESLPAMSTGLRRRFQLTEKFVPRNAVRPDLSYLQACRYRSVSR